MLIASSQPISFILLCSALLETCGQQLKKSSGRGYIISLLAAPG
jgi:hypothetical protein